MLTFRQRKVFVNTFHIATDFYVSVGAILYNDRVVIPPQFCYQVLCALHAAHQRVSAMKQRARATVFWPGMTQDICSIRDSCACCNQNAPSQVATPRCPPTCPFEKPTPIRKTQAITPFEKIFVDHFDYADGTF